MWDLVYENERRLERSIVLSVVKKEGRERFEERGRAALFIWFEERVVVDA